MLPDTVPIFIYTLKKNKYFKKTNKLFFKVYDKNNLFILYLLKFVIINYFDVYFLSL